MILLLERLFLGLSFVVSLKEFRGRFQDMEVLIFAFTLLAMVQKSSVSSLISLPILFSAFYSFLYPFTLSGIFENLVACGLNPITEAQKIQALFPGELKTVWHTVLVVILFTVVQVLSVLFLDKNTRRKNFHFASFLIFIRQSELTVRIGQCLIFFAVSICKTGIIRQYFALFLNTVNRKKDCFSHVFLLCAVIYPYFFLNSCKYIKLLISICIMDSFASIAGSILGRTQKTLAGFISGQLFSYAVEFYFWHTVDFRYHLVMGMIEFTSPINDNIAIAFFSCVYQLAGKQLDNHKADIAAKFRDEKQC